MDSPITLECDIYNACRTNLSRAKMEDSHYHLPTLAELSGAYFYESLADLQWCAEHGRTDMAINIVTHFAEALLSAYQIQAATYKK